MGRGATLGILLLAAGAAGAWLLRGDDHPNPVDPSIWGDTPPGSLPAAGPTLAAATRDDAGPRRGRGSIAGVVRQEGTPVPARVQVRRGEWPPEDLRASPGSTAAILHRLSLPPVSASAAVELTAGPDGRYEATGLAAGLYLVIATAENGARGEAGATLALDGAHARADVSIQGHAESLRGRVRYADGRPFAGTVLVATAPGDRSWPSGLEVRAAVDETGTFVATGLPRADVTVTAVRDGVLRVSSGRVPLPQRDELILIVDAGTTPREGRVVAAEDGRPIEGATVLGGGRRPAGGALIVRTASDAAGRFRLWLPAEGGALRAVARGFAPLRMAIEEIPPPPETIVFRLARGATLTGQVTAAADGRPVPGVRVRVVPQDYWHVQFFPPEPATTDASGRYVLEDLIAGEAVAFAEGAGWATPEILSTDGFGADPLRVDLVAGGTETLDLRIVRTTSARGVVLDPSGAPVEGAVVRAFGRQSPRSYSWLGAIENVRVSPATTARDGTFEVPGLLGGAMYVFTADLPDGGWGRSGFVRANDDSPVHVEIRCAVPREIVVTVLEEASGTPIAGADVWAEPTESAFLSEDLASDTTNPVGTARLVVRVAGALRLQATAEGYGDARSVTVDDGQTTATVTLPRGLLLSGRVLRPDGSPAAGAEVFSLASEGHPGDRGHFSTRADRAGEFRMTFATPGTRIIRARLSVGGQDWVASAHAQPGADPVVLRLAPPGATPRAPGTLLVRVVGPDGAAVPRAEVAFLDGLVFPIEVRDGRTELPLEGRREIRIVVQNAAAADGSPLPYGPASAGPFAATEEEVVVLLPIERTLEGLVRDPDGRGVRGVAVWAHWSLEDGATGSERAFSGNDGTFRLGRLPDRPVTLLVHVPPGFVRPKAVEVKRGETGIEIALKAGVSAEIRVLDDEGKPVRAEVAAIDPDATDYERVRTDPEGVAILERLDPAATYQLQVEPDSPSALLGHARNGWTPADTTVRLERGLPVRGVVRDPAGRPLAGAGVRAAVATDNLMRFHADVATEGDGTFAFEGLPAGEVLLFATLAEGSSRAVMQSVQAGATDVVLTLDPGLGLTVRIAEWPATEVAAKATLVEQDLEVPVTITARIGPDGTVRFYGLAPDRAYTLWIPPTRAGRSLLRRDVRTAAEPLAVALAPGRTIAGRLTVPPGARVTRIVASTLRGQALAPGTWTDDGSYRIDGLPDGTWTIVATAHNGPTSYRGEAEAAAGGFADVELR